MIPSLLPRLFVATALLPPAISVLPAAITSVVETGLVAPEVSAIIEPSFGEDVLSFSDRAHQHNGAAFNSGTNLLSTTGDLIIGLPAYLIGHSYVRFANDARENAGYSAVITADVPSQFYLLIDNRINGPAGTNTDANTDDPILGGTLQWVLDAAWERVNTGISPNGQPDYTAVDEGGEGTGPGQSLNQFYSVYRFPVVTTQVVVRNNGVTTTNMISVVAVPATPPDEPIESYVAQPPLIAPGSNSLLTWDIDPAATAATIDQGVGNVLPVTTPTGSGSVNVSPLVDTTYTLTVTTPTGSEMATASVGVRPLATFDASETFVSSGTQVTLTWRVRPDATVQISGIGDVGEQTDPDGLGSLVVPVTSRTTFTLTADAQGRSDQSSLTIITRPPGQSYALIDIGATGEAINRPEPGAIGDVVIGAGIHNTNGTNLAPTNLVSETGDDFSIVIDNIDQFGSAVGGLDWRDRGNAPEQSLNFLAEHFVKNNAGIIRVTLSGLPAGHFAVTSYHLDPDNSQCPDIQILVTDVNGTAVDITVRGDASFSGAVPQVAGLNTGLVDSKAVNFAVESDGNSDVVIYFDGRAAADTEVPLNGLWLILTPSTVIEFTSITRTIDGEAANVTLEFTSTPGRTYSIFVSPDLIDWGSDLTDSHPASPGATTTFTEMGIPLSTGVRFYRVQEN